LITKNGEEKSAEQRGTYETVMERLAFLLQISFHLSSYSGKVSIANDKEEINVKNKKIKSFVANTILGMDQL
jgi:hypothetical protein